MSAIGDRFLKAGSMKRGGFIPFIVAGDPDLQMTVELLLALSSLDPIAIELGVPFSDPTADGPVIQRAAQRALERGTSLAKIFQLLKKTAFAKLAPLILFSYYNPIFQFGIERFARAASKHGIAGTLVVDLPEEAAGPLHGQLRRRNIDLIFLVTPTTSDHRLKQIARLVSGFVYAVSRTGVTGSAAGITDESQALVQRIRAISDIPVAVGFGIATRAQARRVGTYADAVVVGSRIVAEIETATAQSLTPDGIVRQAVRCASQFA